MSFYILSKESIANIFSYLSTASKVNCRRVCRFWLNLLPKIETLWTIYEHKYSNNDFETCFNHFVMNRFIIFHENKLYNIKYYKNNIIYVYSGNNNFNDIKCPIDLYLSIYYPSSEKYIIYDQDEPRTHTDIIILTLFKKSSKLTWSQIQENINFINQLSEIKKITDNIKDKNSYLARTYVGNLYTDQLSRYENLIKYGEDKLIFLMLNVDIIKYENHL